MSEESGVEYDADTDILNNPKRYAIAKFKERPFTKKQQTFIQNYVYQDMTNTECAHRAGYAVPTQSASMLLNDPRFAHIQTKIRELQESNQKKYEITFDNVARDLQMIRDAAVEDGSYGAAVSAELGRAKLAGLMVERKEVRTGTIDQMDRGEVEARLQALLDKHELAPVLMGKVVGEEVEDEEVEEELEEEDESDEEELDEELDDDDWDDDEILDPEEYEEEDGEED